MESTTGIWMSTSNNLSLENSTNVTAIPDHNYEWDTTRISVQYITLSFFIIAVNVLVVCLLLTSRECRRKPFYWHVISLSGWFLLVGVFLMPLYLEHHIKSEWVHGEIICSIWSVMWIQNFTLSAFIMFCASLDRMFAKVQLVRPLNQKVMHIINYVLVFSPWFIVITIYTPLTFSFRKDIPSNTKYCIFYLDEKHHLKWFLFFYLVPFSLLALSIFVSILFYILKEGSWERIQSTITQMEITSLRLSTVANWINSIIVFVSWIPVSAYFFANLLKSKDRWKCMDWDVFSIVTKFYEVAPAIIPLMWFLTIELRVSASSWIQTVRNFIHNRTLNHGMSMKWISRNDDATRTTQDTCQ